MRNILIVEDDESLRMGISFKLKKEGLKVFIAENLKEAKEIFYNESIELIILDVNLPDGCGFDFCEEIRKNSEVLILFLTARDEEVDVVTGLDIGADDYIIKPFSFMILMSKINALLRRNYNNNYYQKFISEDIIFFIQDMKVLKNGEEISLSKTELKLLKYLMINSGQIIKKEQMLNELWDIDGDFVDPNTIAVNIRRLREKIEENPSNPKYIKAVRGIGYIWVERCIKK